MLLNQMLKLSMKKMNFISNLVSAEAGEPNQDSKKAVWKFVIQTVINILAAVLTALGATSCIS